MLNSFRLATKLVNLSKLRIRFGHCPVCRCGRPLVRLDNNEIAVRCLWCRSSAVTMSLVSVLDGIVEDLSSKRVYELSSRGPLFRFLKRHSAHLTGSEFFDDVVPGAFKDGIQCQDVQRLTYPDCSFDICTSTEVFEHVPEDARGFAEIRRVLKPAGTFVFTVPLRDEFETVERARYGAHGEILHLLEPEFHGDPLRKQPLLAFRNYGRDIVTKLENCGFAKAEIVIPREEMPWGYTRPVIVASRGPA